MKGNYGANQYKNQSIKTASRGQILIMLYEAAIQHVKKATAAIEKNDVIAKGQSIGKAHDIINELLNTLNFEVGGNIARELERLYNYMIDQLMKANLESKKEPLIVVSQLLENLLSAWKEAVDQVNKGTAKY